MSRNQYVIDALTVLTREATRVKDGLWRKKAHDAIRAINELFVDAESMEVENPPGKVVVRNEKGDVIARQG